MPQPGREQRIAEYREASARADEFAWSGGKDEALAILQANLATATAHDDEDYRALFDAEILGYSAPDFPRQIARLTEGLCWAQELHFPADFFLLRNVGVYHSLSGDQDTAIAWYDKALAENPKDSLAYRWWAHAEFRRGRRAEAQERMCRAVELDPKRWDGAFRAYCKLCGKDPDEEWKRLFPERAPAEREAREDLSELPTFITFVRGVFAKEAEDYLRKMEEGEKGRQTFLKPISRLDPKRSLLMVLRQWNSYTPALPADEDERCRGGGYFLWHNGHGTVIDPGYDFLENFDRARCRICDVDNVVLTHAHNDHTIDFETLRALLHEFNDNLPEDQRAKRKQVRFFLNNGSFQKFAGMVNLRDDDFTDRVFTLNAGGELDLLGGGRLRVLPAYHDELMATDQAVGLLVTLPTAQGERRVLFTGDTGLFPLKRGQRKPVSVTGDPKAEISQRYLAAGAALVEVMVVHIGSIKRQELSRDFESDPATACYPNHLGMLGTARVVTACRPKLAVLSEFGEEMKGIRIPMVASLQENLLDKFWVGKERLKAHIPRIVPGDMPLIYDLGDEKFWDCVAGDWRGLGEIDFATGGKGHTEAVYYFARDQREKYQREPRRYVDNFVNDRLNRRGMYFTADAD